MTLTLSGCDSGPVTEGSKRTLIVMRHAKAEAESATDLERSLAERGHRDAAAAGRWLSEQGLRPDLALVSGALRTRETYATLAEAAGWDLDPTVDAGLYSADPETVIDILRGAGADAATVLVLGHNPTMGTLAQLLDDGRGEVAGAGLTTGDFPTSALAVFSYGGEWLDLGTGTASLTASHVGRA